MRKREYKHYRKATPEYIELLLKTVDKEPSDLGYEFGRWTAERLATYLTEPTGIDLSSSQVRRILKQKKYSYIWARSRRAEYSVRRTRAAKYDLESKQNPIERAKFQEKIVQYLAIARVHPERLQVWFWDESGFSLRVIRRKNWGNQFGERKRGQPSTKNSSTQADKLNTRLPSFSKPCLGKRGRRKNLTGQRRRGRLNVMGGIREGDRKRVCFLLKKVREISFMNSCCNSIN